MNCWWMNGGGLSADELDRLLTLGEKAGVRIYWADGGHPLFLPWNVGTAESRKQRHENEIVPLVREWAARFRDRWGLLAWGLCEEMPPSAVEELADYVLLWFARRAQTIRL
ncbi:MAG: hypothetical protein HPY69_07610 [Armatimonadetes bacterium]|nr:hypothetical protein [Armatimonadota bacterium]